MKPVFGMQIVQTDERGRIRIPQAYQKAFGEVELYGFKNRKGDYLSIFGEDTLDDIMARMSGGIGIEEDDSVGDARDIYKNIFLLQSDKQGRFTLPSHLRDELKISKEVLFIGMGKKIEMWDKLVYEEYEKNRKGKQAGGSFMIDGKPLTY